MTTRNTVGVGAVLLAVAMGWLLWPPAGGGDVRAARGTVVQSVLCAQSDTSEGQSDTSDGLRVELPDGREITARLDGCGHRLGEVLAVEVPDPLPTGEVVARLAGTGVPTGRADGQRLGAAGVAVAGIAGALLAWRLRGGRSATRRRVSQ